MTFMDNKRKGFVNVLALHANKNWTLSKQIKKKNENEVQWTWNMGSHSSLVVSAAVLVIYSLTACWDVVVVVVVGTAHMPSVMTHLPTWWRNSIKWLITTQIPSKSGALKGVCKNACRTTMWCTSTVRLQMEYGEAFTLLNEITCKICISEITTLPVSTMHFYTFVHLCQTRYPSFHIKRVMSLSWVERWSKWNENR